MAGLPSSWVMSHGRVETAGLRSGEHAAAPSDALAAVHRGRKAARAGEQDAHRVVLRLPSSRSSVSMVMAWAGQICKAKSEDATGCGMFMLWNCDGMAASMMKRRHT